jgi:hypothetical protein
MHLVQTGRSQTWKKRGAKDIKVLDVEDKHQVTVVRSFVTSDDLLPLQQVVICYLCKLSYMSYLMLLAKIQHS